jgi:septal ring factor EnvC (AmiA/AmiB activator)
MNNPTTTKTYDKGILVLSEPACPSCGVPFVDHLGLAGTCQELQSTNATIATLRATVADLQADCQMHEREITNLQADLVEARHSRNVAVRQLQAHNKKETR